jgi:hypothetical protein
LKGWTVCEGRKGEASREEEGDARRCETEGRRASPPTPLM